MKSRFIYTSLIITIMDDFGGLIVMVLEIIFSIIIDIIKAIPRIFKIVFLFIIVIGVLFLIIK